MNAPRNLSIRKASPHPWGELRIVMDVADQFCLPPRRSGAPWSRERDEALERLFALGLSFDLIASLLGETRNATIGRAWRIGLDESERPIGIARRTRLDQRGRDWLCASTSRRRVPRREVLRVVS